jgi:predicted aspartyl protease
MALRSIVLSAALICSSALDAQTLASTEPANGSQIDRSTQAQSVTFRNGLGERMTVPVRLGGAGPYQFLVDTGANRSAVSSVIASRLALAPAKSVELHSTSGVATVMTARVPSLEFTRPAQTSIEAAVLESANMGADGIVGVDLLGSQRVQFDFDTSTLTIVPSASPGFRDEPGMIVVEARRKNGRLVLADAKANGQAITAVIDTGSEICVGNEALRQRLFGPNAVAGKSTIELQSVTGGIISGDYVHVHKLQIGDIVLSDVAVVFADAHTFKQLNLDRKPALLLGMNAFRAFRKVSIDFAKRQFQVVVPEHSEIETRLAMAGSGQP